MYDLVCIIISLHYHKSSPTIIIIEYIQGLDGLTVGLYMIRTGYQGANAQSHTTSLTQFEEATMRFKFNEVTQNEMLK